MLSHIKQLILGNKIQLSMVACGCRATLLAIISFTSQSALCMQLKKK